MRILHTMLRVGDLERSLAFYTEVLGMRLLRRHDYPDGKFTLAFVGYHDEADGAVLELTHNWGVDTYELGTAYGHIALEVPDAAATIDHAKRVRLVRAARNRKGALPHITGLNFYSTGRYLILGTSTRRNLELFESISGDRKNTLFGVMNRTSTPMGARLLADFPGQPALDHLPRMRLDLRLLRTLEPALDGLRTLGECALDVTAGDLHVALTGPGRIAVGGAAPTFWPLPSGNEP